MRGGRPLRVNYLLEDTALFGGVKVVLHHAELLAAAGHLVTVIGLSPRPEWYDYRGDFVHAASFDDPRVPPADIHVATYWTTISAAMAMRRGQALHFCQGFEASYTHNVADHPRILEAYAAPIPAITVAPHLVTLLSERFGRVARVVPPALDRFWKPRWRRSPGRPPRVVVVGPWENDWKGVRTGLEAVARLRESGHDLQLVRISQWALGDDERRVQVPDEYHTHVSPPEVADILAGCDLLLAPSWEQEAFGLPVLEAMASGVPVVGSAIQAFRWLAGEAAELVAPGDVGAMAAAAAGVLGSSRRWRRMRRAGLGAAARFGERRVQRLAAEALGWVADGAWKARP